MALPRASPEPHRATAYPEAMIAIGLALVSATMYGISDFLGGIFAKDVSPWRVAAVGQTSSALVTFSVAWFVDGNASTSDHAWAILAGLGSGIGAAFLYRGLAGANMNVVAPISAVGCALLPVLIGFGLGDRPSLIASIGIVAAFPAIWLISIVEDSSPGHRGGVIDGILAGLGFGVMLTALAQVKPDAGVWPLVSLYITSALAVAVIAISLKHGLMPRNRNEFKPLMMGLVGAPAALAFYYASHHGMLSIVSVITALYPAFTVILAAMFLHERLRGNQGIGLALATIAVGLVAVG